MRWLKSRLGLLPAVAVIIFVSLAVLGAGVAPIEAQDGEVETREADQVESCLAANCHAYRMAFRKSPHSALDTEGIAAKMGISSACAACHGEPVPKPKEPGVWSCDFEVFGFDDEDLPGEKSQRCLTCHLVEHGGFPSSEHARSGVACTECHDVHGRDRGRWPLQKEITVYDGTALQSETPSATCARCHSDVFAEFEFNDRHRLKEGIIQCTSCHDPHERQRRMALGGFKQETCSGCHTDKDGPFVFEHGASRVEGCAACHTPHGSPNRHMLTFQSVTDLCYSCHVSVPGFHAFFPPDTQCTNCHFSIHGSQMDPLFLR